jgi:Rrf2 family nitric oxide-sensitive transcriptional repressor
VRLTVYSDYALRLLMYLAVKTDGLATIAEVADELGVAGYVETVRGRGGGLRLARPREAISLGAVVRHTEPDMALVPCFAPVNADCAIERCCVLRKALKRAGDAFLDVLDGYTLADLVRPRSALQSLLAIP